MKGTYFLVALPLRRPGHATQRDGVGYSRVVQEVKGAQTALREPKERLLEERSHTAAEKFKLNAMEHMQETSENARKICAAELALMKELYNAKVAEEAL